MAVPKRRVSSAKGAKRRASAWTLDAPSIAKCKNCGEYVKSHTMCGACGHYNGREVVKIEED
ncbi:MAG TPA: 50S ribosomal protein L32 [Clostridiales bacterium]|jgi:large subunit ribosomal protein L32|nr:50S ribosomal protein L32 [Clostridiales bacterium]